MSTEPKKALSLRLKTTLITLLIGFGMAVLLVAVNQLALLLRYNGNWLIASAAILTLVVEVMLFAIVWAFVREILLARQEHARDGLPIPAILTGLLSLFVIVAWLFLAPTLSRVGTVFHIDIFAKGYSEPESQIFRTLLILAFVIIAFYYIVLKYRARAIARWIWRWYERVRTRRNGEKREVPNGGDAQD